MVGPSLDYYENKRRLGRLRGKVLCKRGNWNRVSRCAIASVVNETKRTYKQAEEMVYVGLCFKLKPRYVQRWRVAVQAPHGKRPKLITYRINNRASPCQIDDANAIEMHSRSPILVDKGGGGPAPELSLDLCLGLNHSPDDSVDVLLEQSDAASEKRASTIALPSDEESLSDHDTASAASLSGEECDTDNFGVHRGGGAGGDDGTPCGGVGLRGCGRPPGRGLLRGVPK